MKATGTLIIVAAPSGAGKTSLVRALVKEVSNLVISISCTSRPKRPHEVDGEHYFFYEREAFEGLIAEDHFIEYAEVYGQYYGTPRSWVNEQLAAGKDVILEIDWQGAQQVRRAFVHCVGIFILPPSKEELAKRLHDRDQDDIEVIEQRLALASQEIKHYREFDYLLVNDQFDTALQELATVVRSQRLLCLQQELRHKALLESLL